MTKPTTRTPSPPNHASCCGASPIDLLLLAEINRLWFAPLLIAGVSFVYAGTRHEDLPSIFRHTGSCAATMVGIMAGVAVVLELLAYLQ